MYLLIGVAKVIDQSEVAEQIKAWIPTFIGRPEKTRLNNREGSFNSLR